MNSQAETRLACSTKNEICSAQDHLACLPLNDLLPVWSLTLRRVRDLIGFEVESHGTDKYPLLFSPRSVSSPHPETKQRNCQVSHRSGRKRKRKRKKRSSDCEGGGRGFFLCSGRVSDHIKDDAVKNLPQTWSHSFPSAFELFSTGENMSALIKKRKDDKQNILRKWGAVCCRELEMQSGDMDFYCELHPANVDFWLKRISGSEMGVFVLRIHFWFTRIPVKLFNSLLFYIFILYLKFDGLNFLYQSPDLQEFFWTIKLLMVCV